MWLDPYNQTDHPECKSRPDSGLSAITELDPGYITGHVLKFYCILFFCLMRFESTHDILVVVCFASGRAACLIKICRFLLCRSSLLCVERLDQVVYWIWYRGQRNHRCSIWLEIVTFNAWGARPLLSQAKVCTHPKYLCCLLLWLAMIHVSRGLPVYKLPVPPPHQREIRNKGVKKRKFTF